jgi:hypothetical protein
MVHTTYMDRQNMLKNSKEEVERAHMEVCHVGLTCGAGIISSYLGQATPTIFSY